MDVYLVTGGAGFIGSHLVKALVARGHAVRVLDNFSTGSPANLGRCVRQVELIVGDLGDLALVRELVEGVDVVCHLAAPPPDESAYGPPGFPRQCDIGTGHVLLASRDSRVRRVVYASTTQVYGRAAGAARAETDSVVPASPLALAKLSGEQSCAAFTLQYGLETVRLRYSNVFGPRQPAASPHARFVVDAVTALLAGEKPVVEGTGLEPQDLVLVDDVVQATLAAAAAPAASGRVYNVARGRMTNALEVVDALNDLLGTRLDALPTGRPVEEEVQNVVDISRARAELGFSPSADLRGDLARCVRTYSGGWAAGPLPVIERLTEA
jgi:UDP-glucose 4-epimerase